MTEILCAGETLVLLPDKAVFWPKERALIIADLHLGKSAAFRAAGIGVPENTTGADLLRLETLIKKTKSRRVIILGDLLHAAAGMQEAMTDAVEGWRKKNSAVEIILVPGNHDRKAGAPPAGWNIVSVEEEWARGPFLFSHKPIKSPRGYVMAGHIHPALVFLEKFGPGIRTGCFWFGDETAILPAFGSFTGMSSIKPVRGDRIFAIGDGEVIEVKLKSLERIIRRVKPSARSSGMQNRQTCPDRTEV